MLPESPAVLTAVQTADAGRGLESDKDVMYGLVATVPFAIMGVGCVLMMVFMMVFMMGGMHMGMGSMHMGHGRHSGHTPEDGGQHADQTTESPEVRIARLEAELAALRRSVGAPSADSGEPVPTEARESQLEHVS